MTNRQTFNSIPDQFSDFIRAEYPRFVDFLKAYYKFLDQETRTGKLSKVKDIDLTDEEFIANYRHQFAIDIPKFDFLESRRFILFSRALYEAKGTEDALRFLFRAAFGTEIDISYPKDDILRASSGVWSQEHFIDAVTISGEYSPLERLSYESISGSPFTVEPTRHVQLNGMSKLRFYFESKPSFLFDGMRIFQKNSSGTITFLATLSNTPASVSVIEPGTNWKVGQLIKIPGSVVDTFIRVAGINATGGITKIEVVEFGYEHNKTFLFYASPFATDPALTTFSDPNFELSSTGTGPYNHTLTMGDYLFNVAETVTVENSSTLEVDYAVGFETKRKASPVALGISIPLWVQSRAKFRLESGLVGSNKGSWKTEDGHLSNSSLKLQDNFLYQAFSYLISSPVNSTIANDIIRINHPAGLKFFKQLELTAEVDFTKSISRHKQRSAVYLYDTINSLTDELKELSLQKFLETTVDGNMLENIEISPNTTVIDSFEVLDASSASTNSATFVDGGYWETGYSSTEITLNLS